MDKSVTSAIEALNVKTALKTLAERRAIPKVIRLQAVRLDSLLAQTAEYRKEFNGFYKMGRKRPEFYEVFYGILSNASRTDTSPSLLDVMEEIYARAPLKERHLSFSSKLVATLDPTVPIYDANVAATFSITTQSLPKVGWQKAAIDRYQELHECMRSFVASPEWKGINHSFDSAFPEATSFPNMRKADLLLWANYDRASES